MNKEVLELIKGLILVFIGVCVFVILHYITKAFNVHYWFWAFCLASIVYFGIEEKLKP
jgi:hypothetical protein